jgi:hypothetical protein
VNDIWYSFLLFLKTNQRRNRGVIRHLWFSEGVSFSAMAESLESGEIHFGIRHFFPQEYV